MIAPDHTSGELNASGAQHANADLRSNQSNPENMIFRTRAKNQVDLYKVCQVDLCLSHRTVRSCNGPDKTIHHVPWPGASNLSPRNRWPTTKYKMKIRKITKFLEYFATVFAQKRLYLRFQQRDELTKTVKNMLGARRRALYFNNNTIFFNSI